MKDLNFFGKCFVVVVLIELAALWLGCLVGPALLWFFTGNALWALLWLVTLPIFLAVCAWIIERNKGAKK